MNAFQLFADIQTGALVEVEAAKCHFFDNARGVTVRQQFFIYPDDTIVCLNSADGGYTVATLQDDNEVIFRSRNPMYFQ
jgi:hypothetical protein